MFGQKNAIMIVLAMIILLSSAYARVGIKTDDSTVNLGIDLSGWVQTGQMKGFFSGSSTPSPDQWMQQEFLDIGMDAIVNARIRIAGGIEGEMWQNIPKGGATGQSYYVWRYNSTFIVDNAFGSYMFGDTASPFLSITAGRFRYKYDPDSRNLGEYLFRSGTYPAYLITNFDQPYARLTGLKISSDLFGRLHQDLLLTCETDYPPYYDASLSYIGNCEVGNFLNVGWGVDFSHLISVDETQTTPHISNNMYIQNGDTNYYTFRGIKLMGRFSFDPKPFIPTDIFGKEDCKLYAEAAILGVKNYPANDSLSSVNDFGYYANDNPWGYNTLAKKIPVMIGLNLPAFKVLDVLSTEVEWFGSNYPDNLYEVDGIGTSQSLPLPYHYSRDPYDFDHWKWSVYAKKTLARDRLEIIAQFGRDHSRLQTLVDNSAVYELEEAQTLPNQWYWMTKLVAQF
jgi:hypothetical protein